MHHRRRLYFFNSTFLTIQNQNTMYIHLSIALTLLAIIAGMFLLAKTRTESLGKLFSFISYAIIFVAGLSLACQLTSGVCRMACRTSGSGEQCEGMSNCSEMKHGRGHGDCCKGGEGKSGCMERGGEGHEMEKDSAGTK